MSNRADEIREQARRVASKPSNRSDAGQAEQARRESRPGRANARTKPVGKTINLDAALNADVSRWLNDTAASLGVARVTFQQTTEALLRTLTTDSQFGEQIKQEIRKQLDS